MLQNNQAKASMPKVLKRLQNIANTFGDITAGASANAKTQISAKFLQTPRQNFLQNSHGKSFNKHYLMAKVFANTTSEVSTNAIKAKVPANSWKKFC